MLYFAHAPLTLVASASFSTAMICSSLNRLLFIGSAPHYRAELYLKLVRFFGVRPLSPSDTGYPVLKREPNRTSTSGIYFESVRAGFRRREHKAIHSATRALTPS